LAEFPHRLRDQQQERTRWNQLACSGCGCAGFQSGCMVVVTRDGKQRGSVWLLHLDDVGSCYSSSRSWSLCRTAALFTVSRSEFRVPFRSRNQNPEPPRGWADATLACGSVGASVFAKESNYAITMAEVIRYSGNDAPEVIGKW